MPASQNASPAEINVHIFANIATTLSLIENKNRAKQEKVIKYLFDM